MKHMLITTSAPMGWVGSRNRTFIVTMLGDASIQMSEMVKILSGFSFSD